MPSDAVDDDAAGRRARRTRSVSPSTHGEEHGDREPDADHGEQRRRRAVAVGRDVLQSLELLDRVLDEVRDLLANLLDEKVGAVRDVGVRAASGVLICNSFGTRGAPDCTKCRLAARDRRDRRRHRSAGSGLADVRATRHEQEPSNGASTMAFRELPVRPPARPLRVLDPRRGVPDPGARRQGGPARDAGGVAHRPRLAGRRDRPLQGRQQAGREADHRLRGVRHRRPARADEGHGAPHPAGRDDGRLRAT